MQSDTRQIEAVLMTVEEAAKRLSLCRRMVEYSIQKGELEAVRFGRAVRIRPAALEAFIQSKTKSA